MLNEYKTVKKYRTIQYISGFGGLGLGIGALYGGIFVASNSGDPTSLLAGLATGVICGVTGAIVSSVFKHKRYAKKKEIANFYSEMK
jgi:hypothetical protein